MPVFQWPNPANFGKWEFIRVAMKESQGAWWGVDPLLGMPGFALAGWKSTAIRSHLEAEYGGPVAQNVGASYSLMAADRAYLATLGVDADTLLAWMNAHTNITARQSAREVLGHYGSPGGRLRRPVVTIMGSSTLFSRRRTKQCTAPWPRLRVTAKNWFKPTSTRFIRRFRQSNIWRRWPQWSTGWTRGSGQTPRSSQPPRDSRTGLCRRRGPTELN